MGERMRVFVAGIAGLVVMAGALQASTQEVYKKGKVVRIVVSAAAGGGFDTYARTIARHMGKHIPGNPGIIVENMPGAGGLIAANHVYRVAKPDGLTIGNFSGGLVTQQLLGSPGIEFDARKLEWIGVPVRDHVVCALTKASGITSVEGWMAAKTPLKLGATGPGTNTHDTPRVLLATLGLPIHVVAGYKGTADVRLAAEGGELAGGCWSWESVKVTWRKALEAGDVNIVLQAAPKAHPDLPRVPLAMNYAKTDEARQLMQIGIHHPSSITRLYTLPPGTPRDRVQLLRRAFAETMKDPEFVAEAQKSKLDIDPVSGEEVAQTVARLFEQSPTLIAKLKETLAVK